MAQARRSQVHIGPPDDSPVLQEFYDARGEVDIVIGPLGSGKTFGFLQRNLAMASEQAPNAKGIRLSRCGVLRNSWPELETATLPDIERFFGPMGARITRGIPPSMTIEAKLSDGTTMKHEMVFVAGLDQPDSEEKLRGHQWTWVWGNELRQIPLGVFGMAIARTGRYPTLGIDGANPTWSGGLGDTNAFDVDHPLYALMQAPPPGWNFFVQPPGIVRTDENSPWRTNPLAENLSSLAPDYYERIAKGRPEDWIRVNLANEFIFHIEGRPVYPQYKDTVHCAREDLLADFTLPLYVGIDFGRTPAATVSQYLPALARWNGIAELTTVDTPAAEFAPRLKAFLDLHFPGFKVAAIGDPAGDRAGQTVNITPIQLIRAAGIPCQPAYTNDPLLRRAALSKPMTRLAMDGKPAFQISPGMRMLRKGLQGAFCYKRAKISGTERYSEEPDKNEFSHVCFGSTTQISTPSGPVAIETIRVGQPVNTPFGPRPVTHIGNRMARVIERNGLIVTPDHPFLVRSGKWRYAGLLNEQDVLVTEEMDLWTRRSCLRSAQEREIRSMSFKASGTTGMASTTETFTEWSGQRPMDLSQMAVRSTTSTGIRSTTHSQIFNASIEASILGSTARPMLIGSRLGNSFGFTPFRQQPPGERETQMTQSVLRETLRGDDARHGAPPGPSPASARSAETHSRPTNSRPIAPSTARNSAFSERVARVYTLTVADEHCYYAGGFLVSNCEAMEYGATGIESRGATTPYYPGADRDREEWPEFADSEWT